MGQEADEEALGAQPPQPKLRQHPLALRHHETKFPKPFAVGTGRQDCFAFTTVGGHGARHTFQTSRKCWIFSWKKKILIGMTWMMMVNRERYFILCLRL
mmetsp:Transcript_51126/g.134291  ORF Transcript_51126/g.134291 Transcript_51126/m.134291 type:complete len:99 (-) Transcript_51126:25-321(-)